MIAPMLTAYPRHVKTCPHHEKGRSYRRCKCPIWVQGTLRGENVRESLKTNSWARAQAIIAEWEERGYRDELEGPMEIGKAIEAMHKSLAGRSMARATVKKYRVLFEQFAAFCEGRGLTVLAQLDIQTVREFRHSWADKPLSATKKLERLRAFFRFCVDSEWIAKNPAATIKAPVVSQSPTLPFTRKEMSMILTSCDQHGRDPLERRRVRAFVLLMRYSGLRIKDVAQLRTSDVTDDRLMIHTEKTKVTVYVPIPPVVTQAVEAVQPVSSEYLFWTGHSDTETLAGNWRRSLKRVFRRAGLEDGHSHRLRDTFAVELLLAGTPIERVSRLLGHRSIKVTERHYSPWVKERQEQAEADVRRAWALDPIVSGGYATGTREPGGIN